MDEGCLIRVAVVTVRSQRHRIGFMVLYLERHVIVCFLHCFNANLTN